MTVARVSDLWAIPELLLLELAHPKANDDRSQPRLEMSLLSSMGGLARALEFQNIEAQKRLKSKNR